MELKGWRGSGVDRRKGAVVIIDLVGGAKQVFYVYTKEVSLAGRGAVRSKEKKLERDD